MKSAKKNPPQAQATEYVPEHNWDFPYTAAENRPWNDHVEEQAVFALGKVVARWESGDARPGGGTDETFAAVVDRAPVDQWRLGGSESEGTSGRSSEADIGENVGVVGLLDVRILSVYTDGKVEPTKGKTRSKYVVVRGAINTIPKVDCREVRNRNRGGNG